MSTPTTNHQDPKEVTVSHSLSHTFSFQPSQAGALSGNAAVCECGFECRTSLSTAEAVRDLAAHVAYMNKKEGRK